MPRWQRLCSVAVPISLAVGIAFDFLPRNWIELRLGVGQIAFVDDRVSGEHAPSLPATQVHDRVLVDPGAAQGACGGPSQENGTVVGFYDLPRSTW